ncbi:MAG: cold shock domain-containing protein [Calditrichaeota bacterium]|nr:cold shock domain-containing protein [Calditrichota bacterium]
MEKVDRHRGVVESFLPRKGYGFIKSEGLPRLFVHFTSIRGSGFKTLEVGEEVEFSLRNTERGLQALDVERLNPPEPPAQDATPVGSRSW